MNNKEKFKGTFSNLSPSDECMEKIFDMTSSNKYSKNQIFRRIVSATLALAVLVGGGYGATQFFNDNDKQTKIVSNVSQNSNPLSIMVAYAGEYKSLSELKAGNMYEQGLFYSIHFADINDTKALENAEKLYSSDKVKLEKELDALSEQGYSGVIQAGRSVINSVKGEATVRVNILMGGAIALNIDDYSVVKKVTIKNESNYGELYFNYATKSQKNRKEIIGNNISVSGKELEISQASKVFECGTKNPINKGYRLFWGVTDNLYKSIGQNLNFDLTQIKDTITFTVEFNDGEIQTARLNLYFDSDGYMHIG
ncbi:hypothetical protein [uncultured Eubacterium sp.]|uniref:hypothetical protein n=1 Tax=uncultured Eubacterium sp. TaxID=165185 RepID=UPI0025F92366|nr:hypothetical protein [uncultured Eubacterium sp.]